jgi:hypothetical protein
MIKVRVTLVPLVSTPVGSAFGHGSAASHFAIGHDLPFNAVGEFAFHGSSLPVCWRKSCMGSCGIRLRQSQHRPRAEGPRCPSGRAPPCRPLTIGACLGGSRRLDPVTRLRAESAIAANVMAPHHRQTPPEERGMKKNAGRICGNFLFGGLDG